jgi:hypothetical protein
MYNNKLAAAIKAAGKVLREFDKDKIYLPFGSEYSIYLKNMNSVRAVAHVSIDGKDVGDGRGFVVPANGTIDIERFITNGNLEEGNCFKFIERTGKIEEHRGIGVEDGLIQVRFQFERKVVRNRRWDDNIIRVNSVWDSGYTYGSGSPYIGSPTDITCSSDGRDVIRSCSSSDAVRSYSASIPQNETGITAPGSLSEQTFSIADDFPLEDTEHTMVFHLLGETEDNREVREAVTVKHKPKCSTCGTVNKHDAKFCSECGTSLHVV